MTFDFTQYQDTPTQPHTGISIPTNQEKPINPVSMGIVGAIGLALAGSFVTSVPGLMTQYKSAEAIQARMAANGLVELSDDDAATALKTAKPLVDAKTLQLVLVNWEFVVNSKEFPPGSYFTENAVIVKGINGAGRIGDTGQVAGHSYASISPEAAAKRFAEYKTNLKKIQGN